jgi:hypothetical protein
MHVKERLGRDCDVWLGQISVLKEVRGVTTYRCPEPARPDGFDEHEPHGNCTLAEPAPDFRWPLSRALK